MTSPGASCAWARLDCDTEVFPCPAAGQTNIRACAVGIQKTVKFHACAKIAVSGSSVNGESKKHGFKDRSFTQCKWALCLDLSVIGSKATGYF